MSALVHLSKVTQPLAVLNQLPVFEIIATMPV